jgi:hypothetical protein
MDAQNETEFASKEALDYWQNVDLYIGGSEHATLLTTVFVFVHHAQTVALPNGGSPVSVGKYFSTSGKAIGKCLASIICGIPSL